MPQISIIMGTYNSSKTICRAIDSILNQTFSDFEFIICDDCSTDNTLSILENYEKTDKRISIINNKVNTGLAVSLNRCIDITTTKIIVRMDDDDVSHKHRFKKQFDFMSKFPEYTVVGTSRNLFDDNGVWGTLISDGERSIIDIFKGISFAHPTVFIRKEALNSVGNYSTNKINRRGQDYDLWCKLYYDGYKGINMEEILYDYYESSSSMKRRKFKYRINDFKKKIFWRKKFKLPLYYILYAYKDILAGILPNKIMLGIRKSRLNMDKIRWETNDRI